METTNNAGTELAAIQSQPIVSQYAVLTESGLAYADDTPYPVWVSDGKQLLYLNERVKFFLGDWVKEGRRLFPDFYKQALEVTNFASSTLYNAAWLASAYDVSERHTETLTEGHHAVVAAAPKVARERLLCLAESEGLSVKQLAAKRRELEGAVESLSGGDETPGAEVTITLTPAAFARAGMSLTQDGRQEVLALWREWEAI